MGARVAAAAGILAFSALAGWGALAAKRARDARASVPETAEAAAFRLVAEDTLPYLTAVREVERLEVEPETGRVRGVAFDPFARARREVPGLAYAAIAAVDQASGGRRILALLGAKPPAGGAGKRALVVSQNGAEMEVEVCVASR